MPFYFAPDTAFFDGILDSVASPLVNKKVLTRLPTFTGGDGKQYQVSSGIGLGPIYEIELFEVDKTAVTRTSRQLFTSTEVADEIFSASGLTSETNNFCLGPLGNTGRLLFVSASVVSTSTFSTWRVNSSGNLVCEAAIQFTHGSSYFAFTQNPAGCFLAGDQTASDAIYVTHTGGLWYAPFIFSWRLPSVNGFVGQNGTVFSGTGFSNNLVAIDAGDQLSRQAFNVAPARTSKYFGWCVPDSAGNTRHYYYIGEPDVVANASGAQFSAPGTGSAWINTNAALYGNQLLGYINLGNSTFTPSSLWVPGTTKSIAMSHFVDSLGNEAFPYTLHRGNGLTYDSSGATELFPAPSVKKLSDGTYMVIFASFIPSGLYEMGGTKPLGRYRAFIYTPSTEKHVLVAYATFQPSELSEFINPANGYYADEMAVEYDEDLDKFYYHINVYDADAGDGARYLDIWGEIVPVPFSVPIATPTFLEESDVTYKDFTARFPV